MIPETKPTIEPLALDAHDLADLLRVSTKTVYEQDRQGLIGPAPIQLGERMLRWDAGQIRQWWSESVKARRMIRRTEWMAREREGDR